MIIKESLFASLLGWLSSGAKANLSRQLAWRNIHKTISRWRSFSRSKYMPHQGRREQARRVGGKTWQNFLAADRAARGLHARA